MIFAVLLGLVLVGTVIVLSTVKHYFGVPESAFLTEDEVPWREQDVIPKLIHPSDEHEELSPAVSKRGEAEWDELLDDDEPTVEPKPESDSTATATTTIASVPVTSSDDSAPLASDPDADSPADDGYSDPEDDEEWGIDGKGTGGYWMKADWDGQVAKTESWEHLYDVKIL
jgi:hypothetical protein